MGMVLCKILDQYLSSHQMWTKSIKGFGNNEVLKTLTLNVNIKVRDLDLKIMHGGGDGTE